MIYLVRILILSALITPSAIGGKLAIELSQKISKQSNQTDSEMISVWIKLPDIQNRASFKKKVNAISLDRAKRYKAGIEILLSGHARAQQNLLQELQKLKQQKKLNRFKAHWLVNIVEAEILASELELLSGRSDIEIITLVPNIVPLKSSSTGKMLSETNLSAIGDNLKLVKADLAWQAGYTGSGRIICSLDSGVDGEHPALKFNWQGKDGDSSAAWFDPVDKLNYPHPTFGQLKQGGSAAHGTWTMGAMVGHDDVTGDITGVAPGAKWISAAVLDMHGGSLIDGFEWAVNPDGDFNTIGDVPDVINNSWGVDNIGCFDFFYSIIDNVEALGIVTIFAAGNSGPSGTSILNPANRALDSIDCFAVGAVDLLSPPGMYSFSSRGPSDCNGDIKPNVTAPGVNIRTTSPGGGYIAKNGTSLAAPHVSALVALLREKNPNATVDEIKTAILTTTQTFGYSLPDNNYGWGIIDCMAALNALSASNSTPNLKVFSFDFNSNPLSAGDTVSGTVVLINQGASAANISFTVTASDPQLSILNETAFFGTINEGDTLRSTDIIRAVIGKNVLDGAILTADILISDGGSYSKAEKLYFQVGSKLVRSFVTLGINNIRFSLTNYGTFGIADDGGFPLGGEGFRFNSVQNDLWEGGLMIGRKPSMVSDGVRNVLGEPDGDFAVAPGGNITLMAPGIFADEESYAIFDDSRAENPIGLLVKQTSFAFNTPSHTNYIILQYEITNMNSTSLSNIYTGIYLDWDVAVVLNVGGYDTTLEFLWTADYNSSDVQHYRGIKLLKGQAAAGLTQTPGAINYPDGFNESEKYSAMSGGFSTSEDYKTSTADLNQIISSGPITLAASETDTVTFALIAGVSFSEFSTAATNAQTSYDNDILVGVKDGPHSELPKNFSLSQNFPNPFNPSTTISFQTAVKSEVKLSIYNLLGQEVRVLLDKELPGGIHFANWDGKDSYGNKVSSGIYFYKLTDGSYSISKKMLLLK